MILRLDKYIRTVVILLLSILPMWLSAVEYNYHRVRSGDTLYALSRRYGVSVDQIKRLNNLSSDRLSINQRLKISEIRPTARPTQPRPQPAETRPATPEPVAPPAVTPPPAAPAAQSPQSLPEDFYHTVVQGEGLYRIAVNSSITLAELLRFNGFADTNVPLNPGDRLLIKDPATATPGTQSPLATQPETPIAMPTLPQLRAATPAQGDTVVVEQVYIVQRGDTLYRIATNNGVSVDDLKARNNLSSNEIRVGQRLYIVGTPPSRPVTRAPQVQESETERLRSDLARPVEGRVTSRYGIRNGRPHKGIDIAARTGTPIFAVLAGTVVYSGVQGGYGNVIVIEHPDFVMTIYAHNERNLVSVGDVVTKGQQIATVGSTGDSTGPHLHFEYRIKGKPINPERVLTLD
ncbi:MAG: LysM peptidoglycan-binding domain-containing protein [Candidatus Cloacimonadota bacterium]